MIDGHFKTARKKYVIVCLHRNTGGKTERRKYYEKEIINRYHDSSNGNVLGSNTSICRKYDYNTGTVTNYSGRIHIVQCLIMEIQKQQQMQNGL